MPDYSDPVEDRDVEKLLAMLEDSRVQDKIAENFVVLYNDEKSIGILIPKRNVSTQKKEN